MTTLKYENDEYQEKNTFMGKSTRLFNETADTLNQGN